MERNTKLKDIVMVLVFSIITALIHWGVTRIGAYRLHTFMDIKLSGVTSIIIVALGIYMVHIKKKSVGIGLISGTILHGLLWVAFFTIYVLEL